MKFVQQIEKVGFWEKIKIVRIDMDYKRTLKDGEWVVSEEPVEWKTEILTLEKCFDGYDQAVKYMQTKAFKALLKTVESNFQK